MKRLCFGNGGRALTTVMVLLLLAVTALFTLTGCSSQSSALVKNQQVVELKLAHFFPSTHPAEKELIQPWSEAIEEATNGQVKIISYPQETLLKADAIYDGVVDGIADIGLSCFSYTRGHFPALEAFELPGVTYNNSRVSSKVAWEGIKQINPKEVQDTKLMMVLTTGSGDLFTKNPVQTLADLNGLELRATGLSAKTLKMLGANPVAMPQSDAYESLSKGVVKGNLGPIEVLQGWKQAEVTQYITKTPFLYNTLFFVTMNLDKWNSLSPETQQAIEKVNEEYFEKVAMGLWDKQNEAALKYAVDENGMKLLTLQKEEADRWIALVKPIQDEYVASMKEKGIAGQQILDTVKELAVKYNEEYK
ncbi:MAG: TRAP transporter substrate-binding protein [Desulfotomaculaceae bacterium]|nr:TRAP transporter substrate-binding protein [Desulfotomaculaceae bacterium]MDD4767358.1 TRAP transporter substrate-binding protein [Desulfotomaculaceae bacterium]